MNSFRASAVRCLQGTWVLACLLLTVTALHAQTPVEVPNADAPKPDQAEALPDAPAPQHPCAPGDAHCGRHGLVNWYQRFLNGPEVKPLTPQEKFRLAMRNVADPFNAVTIMADAGIAVGSDAHSVYGPGMRGWGKNVGVSYAQDLSGELICTFLVPSIAHQDPHYHRMPSASIKRRLLHVAEQVVWTQGDNGRPMLNYGDIVGAAISDEVNNLYVPGRKTNASASVERYATGLATAPLDNLTSEFLPDVARHIHVQIVVIQRIINRVAASGSSAISTP